MPGAVAQGIAQTVAALHEHTLTIRLLLLESKGGFYAVLLIELAGNGVGCVKHVGGVRGER